MDNLSTEVSGALDATTDSIESWKPGIHYAAGYPQVPQGKVYEFWILPKAGNPIKAGTFVPDSSGAGKHETTTAQNVGNYAGFAVSLENAPGVDVPTQVVALGKFSNP